MTRETDIDNLFATLRSSEPTIPDQGFSAQVLATLEKQAGLALWKDTLITLLFTLVGCLLAYAFFPMEKLAAVVPSSIHISPMSLVMLTGAIALACSSAYWAAETDVI
jgi:hypothetical protein